MTAEFVRWIRGSKDYSVLPDKADEAACLLTKSGADFRRMRYGKDGLTFTLPLSDGEAVERIFLSHGIEFTVVRERGLRYLIKRYRRRFGIPIGALIFFVVLFMSERFVWTVNVVGNSAVPSEEIVNRLSELGCGVGTYIPSVDFNWLHNEFLLKYDDISWISVNVLGTRATVEVREMEIPEISADVGGPCNLVASESGVIEYVEILRGKPVVKQDAIVHKGDLLASGIEDTKGSMHLTHARGRVMAKVRRNIRIEVPLESSVRTATGTVYSEKYLNIFGISIKFFSNTGNMSSEYGKIEYDTITKKTPLDFFGAVEVPISVRETSFVEYGYTPVTYTEEEARSEAYRRLRDECEKAISGCELVGREMRAGVQNGVYVIECQLTVSTDIAEELPIYTGEENVKKSG